MTIGQILEGQFEGLISTRTNLEHYVTFVFSSFNRTCFSRDPENFAAELTREKILLERIFGTETQRRFSLLVRRYDRQRINCNFTRGTRKKKKNSQPPNSRFFF